MNQIIDQLISHRSIRKFSNQPVEDQTIDTLVKAAQCASTSHHVQAYTIIRVKDREKREAIAELAGPQPWVAQAPVFLVFCADLTRLITAGEQEGTGAETGWTEQFIVATVDTALVAQNLMTAAESMGMGGVFIGGIRNDPQKVTDLLNIPDQAYPIFGLCLGFPENPPETKPRLPLDLVLRTDSYGGFQGSENEMTRDYDRELAHYYKSRSANLKTTTWSGQMARFITTQTRPHMASFLSKKGFLKR